MAQEMLTVNFTYRLNDGQEKQGSAEVSVPVPDQKCKTDEIWRKLICLPLVLDAVVVTDSDLVLKTDNGWYGIKKVYSPHHEIEHFELEVEGFPCLLSSEPSFKAYTCPTQLPRPLVDKPARGEQR